MILSEVFPDWKSNKGIFDYISNPPWETEMDSSQLNLEYFGNHSGSKTVSPLVRKMLMNGNLEDSSRQSLALLIAAKFRSNWKHLWDAFNAEYNPINNYDMIEDIQKDGANQDTNNLKDTTTHGRTVTDTMSHYGFNSSSSQPSDIDSSVEGGTTDVGHTGTVDYKIDEHTVTKRSGNIGVTTNQKMIEEEWNLRKMNFFERVYSDVDSVLALSIYDPCKMFKESD